MMPLWTSPPKPNIGNPIKPIKADALPLHSLVAFFDFNWTSKCGRLRLGYSELAVRNTVLQNPEEFHRGQYAIGNLLYAPFEHVLYGGEFQWARRTNFGDGFHANDYRLQFSFKYNFGAQIGGKS